MPLDLNDIPDSPLQHQKVDEGVIEGLVKTLRSIPHLPNALLRGTDEAGITPEESDLRKRALSTAAQWTIPVIVSAGAELLTGGAATPLLPLITGIVDAAGVGAGSAVAAHIEGGDPLSAGLQGAAFGGAFGVGRGLLSQGAKMAEGQLARSTEAIGEHRAKTAMSKMNAAVGGEKLAGTPGAVELSNVPISGPKYHMPLLQLDMFGQAGQQEMWGPGSSGIIQKVAQVAETPAEKTMQLSLDLRGISGTTSSVTPAEEIGIKLQKIKPTEMDMAGAGAGPEFSPAQHLAAADSASKQALLLRTIRKVGKSAGPVFEDASLLLHRAFAPGRTLLKKLGPSGSAFAASLDDIFTKWRMVGGEHIGEVRQVLLPFKLTDRIHIGEVMEGLVAPKSEEFAKAADALSDIYGKYATEIKGLGIRELASGRPIPFGERENYLTHYYDLKGLDKVLTPGTPEYKRAMLIIEQHGEAISGRSADAALRTWLSAPSEFRTGPINFRREGLLDDLGVKYEKDPLKVMSRYIYDVRKRLEVAKVYGHDYNGVKAVYENINAESGQGKLAKQIFDSFNNPIPKGYNALVKAATTYNTLTMLSTSGIIQPAQLLNTAAIVGYGHTIRAIGAFLKSPASREWALKTGSYLDEAVQDMIGNSESDLARLWVKAIGLEPLDKANRIVAAIAGKGYADVVAQKFAIKQTPQLAEKLISVGLNPAEVLAQGGVLTEEQLRMAAFKVSTNTQFRSSVLDLPELKNHPLGPIFYQFKSFSLQQAAFVQRELLKPMRKGDFAPISRYAAGLGPIGTTIGTMVRGFKGQPTPDNPILEQLDNYALAGGFGMWYDTMKAIAGGPDRFISLFTGPSGGELANFLARDIPEAIKGNPAAIARHVVSRVPGIGQPLVNYWLYPRE